MKAAAPWMAGAIAIALAACGGGSGGGGSSAAAAASSTSSASSASVSSVASSSLASSVASSAASSSVASSVASSAASSAASSVASSSSSSAAAVAFSPANGAATAYVDTRLSITFDAAPTLGTSGYIKVYKTSDDSLVDTISLNVFSTGSTVLAARTGSTLTSQDTQVAIPKANVEIDALAGNVSTLGARYRYMFYRPVSISGNTATIKIHDGKLAHNTSYYVTIDSGVLNGNVSGVAFAGISSKATWGFTTRAEPTSYTDVTVDDDGSTADFRTVQGALNWVLEKCGGTSTNSCNSASVAKTITVKNGTYNEYMFMRNLSNISIVGESRAGVVVQGENFDQLNPGTGTSATASSAAALTTQPAAGSTVRPYLGGGRAVLLVEGGDLLKLSNFTLKNTHVKNVWDGSAVTLNNQAETIYYNSATLTGSRLIATSMNFLSTQDTVNIKGWVWMYQSLIQGDVDFVWGSPFAALFEETELRTVVDTSAPSNGGYVIETRAMYGYPGFVVLNSSLTKEAAVPSGVTYLARQASNFSSTATYCNTMYTTGSVANANLGCNNVAFINTKMDTHIIGTGWNVGNVPPITTATSTAGYRESGSKDLSGATLDVSSRNATYSSTSVSLTNLDTRAEVFSQWNSSTGWTPAP